MKDSTLVLKLQQDDKEAFEHLFRKYHEDIYRFIYYFLASSVRETAETARDLMQDMFLKIWEHRQELDCGQPIKPYLFKTARNLAISYLRHRRVVDKWQETGLQSNPQVSPSPATIMEGLELQSAIHKAVHELPERCALIFILSRYDGLSYIEIADNLNISLQTVKNQMSKAIAILREKLEAYEQNG